MQSTKVALELEVEDKKYMFLADPNCSLGQCFDVLTAMRSHLLERMMEADKREKEANESKDAEASKEEEVDDNG